MLSLQWVLPPELIDVHVEIAKDAYFVNLIVDDPKLSSNILRWVPSDVGEFYWRVTPLHNDGNGLPSDIFHFTVFSEKKLDGFDNEPPPLNIVSLSGFGSIFILKGETEPGAQLLVNGERHNVDRKGKFPCGQKSVCHGRIQSGYYCNRSL